MAVLFGRLIAAQRAHQGPARSVPLGYLGRLARSFEDATAATPRNAAEAKPIVSRLVDPLTEREQQVLRLLAVGEPNQQIAKELVVSLDTVKKHVSHILGKLGAGSRTEATARARELGLLP
ncbi:MAG TPA: response regulator transcription factor [Streptosporangiaceae bacterium]|nr:response regulator transcription factor [Streptosporangiaceae bacterium]